jgi:hypothetical protein
VTRHPVALLLLALPLLSGADLRTRMQTHWRLASALQTAVISGNLDVAHQMATRLADLPVAELPEDMTVALTELRMAAGEVSLATDIEAAAVATARLGASCASCHAQVHQGPQTHPRSIPPGDWAEGMRMSQHQWAADWMWLGFVAPSQTAWDRGARELARASFPDAEHLEQQALQDMVRELASRAPGLSDRAQQTSLLGELFSMCAECHIGS